MVTDKKQQLKYTKMAKALTNTEFKFEKQKSVYHGKVQHAGY